MREKEIAALPSVARNDKKGIMIQPPDGGGDIFCFQDNWRAINITGRGE
jgi:hypothetical protein